MAKKAKSTRNRPDLTIVDSPRESESGPASSFDAFLLFDERLNCVSASATGILAALAEELFLGKHILEISPDTKRSGRYQNYLNVIRTGEPFTADDVVAPSESGDTRFAIKAFKVGNGLGVVASDITGLVGAEEALRESGVSYQELVENTSDIVFTVSAKGTFTALNPAFEALTGWSRAEWIGKPSASLVHPDDLPLANSMFRHLLEREKPSTYELRMLSKPGECLVVELVMTPQIRGGRVVGVLGIARDITERRRDEEELGIKNSAIVSSINAILLADLEGNITYVNPSFLRMWGYDGEEEVLGKNALESWQIGEEAREAVEALPREGGWRGEVVSTRKDGSTFDVQMSASVVKDKNGRPVCWMASFIDISERKKAEEALRYREEYFRSLIDNSLDTIVILNGDGTQRYRNPSYEHVLGYKPEDGIGDSLFEHIHPDDVPKVSEEFAQMLQSPGGILRSEVRAQHADGSWHAIEAVGHNLLDDPIVQGIVVNMRDATERRQAEEALRQSEEKFKRFVEDMKDGYCVLQGSRVVFANTRIARMFGYTPEEVMGKTVQELLPPEIIDGLSRMRARRQRGEKVPEQYETTLVGKDGAARPVEFGLRITEYEGNPALSVVIRDISERKRAEEALRASEEHYSTLVGSLADVVFKFRDGVITWCNERVQTIYGYARDELIGKEASFFYPEGVSSQEFAREVSASIKERGVFYGTNEVPRKDGGTVYVEYSVSMIPGSDPIELVAVVRDITERKQMEEALRQSEEQYSALVANLADAVFRFREGAITWCNDKIQEMLGYTKDEMIGQDVGLFMPSDDTLSEVYREVDVALKKEGHFHGMTRARRKDGSVADIEYSASQMPGKDPIELVGVARDVTDRRRMEEALRQSEENYRVLFESRLDGVLVVEAETMRVLLANQIAAEMYGFDSVTDVIGANPLDFIHPDDRDRALTDTAKGVFEDDLRQINDYRALTKDGKGIWISTVGTRMEYQGRLAGLVSVRDITGRKRGEEEKQMMEQQLQLTGRLAAVGELAAGVAHELNNPLAAVQAYAQFLADRKDLDETIRSDVETIHKEAQRASRITSNLLSFARRHKPEKNLICVNEVIEKSLELHAYRMRVDNIEVLTELDPDLPRTMADFHQMQQVFVNIITNAEQAMTEARGEGKLIVKTQMVGEMIQAAFADNGPGMSADNLKRIFDPFFTTKEVGRGTGLGLSICYGIVQEHGGQLYARSKLGEGTTFVVEIPRVSEAKAGAGQTGAIKAQEA